MRNNFVMSTYSAMVSVFRSQGSTKTVGNPGSTFTGQSEDEGVVDRGKKNCQFR